MANLVTMERWKLVTAIAMSLVVGLLVGFLIERARVQSSSAAALPTATAGVTPTTSAAVSDSPSPTPTPAATPSATATPAPTPAPTLAPPPPIGNASAVFNASGTGNGGPYTLPALKDNWGLSYSFLCAGNGQFNVTILNGGTAYPADPPFATIGNDVQGAQQLVKGGIALQLSIRIDGSCQWKVSAYNGNG